MMTIQAIKKILKPGVILNYAGFVGLLYAGFENYDCLLNTIRGNPELSLAAASALFSSLGFAYQRRVVTKKPFGDFFQEKQLMRPLTKNRSRYSDRMAYILAEMSELAYFKVERDGDTFTQFVKKAISISKEADEKTALEKIIDYYKKLNRTDNTTAPNIVTVDDLKKELASHGFSLSKNYLNAGSAQGFVCVWNPPEDSNENFSPYIVVAFRGTERNIEDWLTDLDAVPSEAVKPEKVHRGFYNGFIGIKDQLEAELKAIRDEYGNEELPVYFTGHSLGGAVATIATRELMPDGEGACYTFGAPRVGDYDYFQFVKTPIYRVVNSSDIVPRVPPGAWTSLISKALALLRYLTVKIEFIEPVIAMAERTVNKLKDYRHFGDLRYLTDVPNGGVDKAVLLRNPAYLDVVQWFWRHVFVSFGMPVKSHSMSIYRKKLRQIGIKRLEKIPVAKSIGYFS